MRKEEFLDALRQAMEPAPAAEIEKTVLYYREMIEDRIEDGLSEEQAVADLEDVQVIAQRVKCELPLGVMVKAKAQAKGGLKGWHILLIVLGFPLWFSLGVTLFSLVLSLYLILWSLIVTLFATVAGFALSGLLSAAFSPVVLANSGAGAGIFLLGSGLILLALSVFLFFPALASGKGLVRLTVFLFRKLKGVLVK